MTAANLGVVFGRKSCSPCRVFRSTVTHASPCLDSDCAPFPGSSSRMERHGTKDQAGRDPLRAR